MSTTNLRSLQTDQPRYGSLQRQEFGRIALLGIALTLFTIFLLFPFYWMVMTSFRDGSELFNIGSNPLIPRKFTLQYYDELLTQTHFLVWMGNSLYVSAIASAIAMVLGTLAAYSLGRLRYKGGGFAALLVFSTYLIPPALLFIPLNSVVNFLGLSDKLWSLIITYLTFLVPFISWMLSSYFKGLPPDLVDSALIDGATRIQAMFTIDLPLVLPGLVSVFFFAFTLSWSEYLYAYTFVRIPLSQTVAVGVVNQMQIGDIYFWGQLMAGAVMGSVPVVIIYSFLMDYYLAGLTAGSVKG